MGAKNDEAERLRRYEEVTAQVVARPEFGLAEVKGECAEIAPVFVTRVVRELEQDGYLEQDGEPQGRFRWVGERTDFAARAWIESKVFNSRVTRAPVSDRPRERLIADGAASLRTADLLAILVRSGQPGESALQAGDKIAARYSDRLHELPQAGRGELKAVSRAVADAAYCQIMAGIELGRRVERAAQQVLTRAAVRIRSAEDAKAYCEETFRRLAEEGTQEEFHVVSLDTKHQVTGTHLVSVGLLGESLIAPREVFRPAIRDAAAAVILVHNHPSGDPTPSAEDLAVTRRLEEVAETIGIKLLDHIVVARRGSVSIREWERTA